MKTNPQRSGTELLWQSLFIFLLIFGGGPVIGQSSFPFVTKTLQNENIGSATSLQFGPDGRLYVVEVDGDLKIYTIELDGGGNYNVVATENITFIKNIPNHNDDATACAAGIVCNQRQVTGIVVGGTSQNPVFYVSSSDSRKGAGSAGGDLNLDTNSGIITRASWNGSSWEVVDIVRGLPRSEENHATNGMELVNINGTDYLIVCSGGFTNAGAPSNNFAYITEYALSGAVLSVNLTMLEGMPVLTDPSSGRQYIYDLPTLDDPTRPNANGIDDPDDPGYDGIDINDPWGGNDGLNMAMLVPGSPVEMFSPGYRNTYDLVVTESGAVYVTDNGANGGWGGYPANEATPNVLNNYRNNEPGSSSFDTENNEPKVNNKDHLDLVTTDISTYAFGSVYGGHPCPVRANVNAGLYTRGTHSDGAGTHPFFTDDAFRTQLYDPDGSTPGSTTNPEEGLPANWPPVDPSLINVDNADFRQPTTTGDGNPDGPEDIIVLNWPNNTNGIDEYTASNFGGAMKGNLIAGKSGGTLHRIALNPDGSVDLANSQIETFANVGGNPLGVTCQGDGDIFPGTIWLATFNGSISILEPDDFVECILPGETGYDPNGDNDSDGFTNQDEDDNGTDLCSASSIPNDLDGDLVSDLNDDDDDGDGILDVDDNFQLGQPFDLPVINELFSDALGLQVGFRGMGLTGLMNNKKTDDDYLNWLDDPNASNDDTDDIYGGAIGGMTIYHTAGDAAGALNTQEKAFQYGVNVGSGTGAFLVTARMFPPFHNWSPTESQGLFIGTGDQDNYIKAVLTTENGNPVMKVVTEFAGVVTEGATSLVVVPEIFTNASGTPITIPGNVNNIDLFFNIDPATATVEVSYMVDDGARVAVGNPFVVPNGPVKTAIQDINTPLAVGVIGTADTDDNFASNWDFINVLSSTPFVELEFPDLQRMIGDPADVFNLDDYFGDDAGDENLTYLAVSDNPAIGAAVNGNQLTLTYPTDAAATAEVTLTATDGDALQGSQSFVVTVLDEPVPVLRVNAGGIAVAASDGGPTWLANDGTNLSGGYAGAGAPTFSLNTGNVSTHNVPASNRHVSVPAYITDAEFTELFKNERWDPPSLPEMLWTFTVPPGSYEVRLYMANGFAGTSAADQREFDVFINNVQVLDNKDLSGEYGHQVGVMEAFQTDAPSGTIQIEFIHQVENPLINAIEILAIGGDFVPPIVVEPIPDQINKVGDQPSPSVDVAATGGDPGQNFTFSAVGLPPGIDLEPTNGDVFGTIAAEAEGNVYNPVITVSKPGSDPVDLTFQWTILGPIEPGQPVYRINAGGAPVAASELNWDADQSAITANGTAVLGTPSPYVNSEVQDLTFGGTSAGLVNTTGYPGTLFVTERFNTNAGTTNNMKWSFPVENGDYVVNLLFCELWTGAQSPGVRVFDVFIEGQLALDDLDQTEKYGWKTAAVETFPITVEDGVLNIDFVKGIQNPVIKGIEILAAGTQPPPPAETDAAAFITVLPNNNNINTSTFTNGSFKIQNNSASGQNITSVTFDLSTTMLPEMVFDPNGTAGDLTAKPFTINNAGGTGNIGHTLSQPYGSGGFRQLDVTFDDFNPGELMSFSIDVDPTSIAGLLAPGPGESGSVSGLELTGATVTVTFNDGSVLVNQLYNDGTNSGGIVHLQSNLSPAPTIAITGLTSPTTTNTASHTVEITNGPANGIVSLLQVEAGFFENAAGLDQLPYEVNSAIEVNRLTSIALDGSGAATVNVTLTDTDPEAGYNYFIAAVENASEVFGNTSNPFIVLYDADLTNLPPGIDPIADLVVDEGAVAATGITATDNENDELTITFELENTTDNSVVDPTGYTFTDNGDGTADFSWTTAVGDAGVYLATVTVSDGVNGPVTASFQITVNGQNAAPVVTNPGNQSNQVGDVVNLAIAATDDNDCGDLTYEATGLPPGLNIDPATGVISGTIEAAGGATPGPFIEQNGLVVIEMESVESLPGSWKIGPSSNLNADNISSPETATGGQFILWEGPQYLSTPGNGLLTYQVQINNPGVYRIWWRNQVGNGTSGSEHNDTWMKVEADAFYGDDGQGSIVCPDGIDPSTNDCVGEPVEGASSDGWFKVYNGSLNWGWGTGTNDFGIHPIFARFDAPGTYNILVSARSSYHVLDRLVMASDLYGGSPLNLNLAESPRLNESADELYNVAITVTDNCVPALSTTVEFDWNVSSDAPQDATLNLTVQSQGRTDFSGEHTVELYDPADTDIPVYQFTPAANAQGAVQLTGIAPADYLVLVDRAKYLARVQAVQLAAGTNAMTLLISNAEELRAGDANDDNQVTLLDFSILATTFGLQPGADGYDDRADFNDDGIVNLLDFSLLASNFNVFGETPLTAGQEIEIRDQPVTATADLSLQWQRDRVLPGEEVTAALVLRAGAQQTDAVAALFRYDTDRLELTGIEWTDAFDLPLREVVDPRSGTIDLAIGTLTNYTAGEQTVARVYFRAKAAGRAALRFEERGRLHSDVTFAGVSVLGQLRGADLEIGEAAAPVMSLRVFPVPARERVNVIVQNPADPDRIELRIYNATGQLMQRQMLTQPTVSLDKLSPGMYILEVSSGQEILHSRIIME